MIREDEVLDAIAECQGERNPDARTCRNLAAFYTILDHIQKPSNIEEKPLEPAPHLRYEGTSEFYDLIRHKDINEVLSVIDELMSTLQIINPRLYDGVMNKLS